jgi:serine/threonine-protein kinase
MVDILHAKFTGEGGPRAVDPRTMMSVWHGEVSSDHLDLSLEESLQLAERVGAGQVLLGGIVGSGDQLTINSTLYRLPGGASIAEASVAGANDSLPWLIDQLVVVVQMLGLQAGERESRLPSLSTSLPAVRAYLAGQRSLRRGRFLEAIDHFDRALAADSSFALAALGLTGAGASAGNTNTDAYARGAPLVLQLFDRFSTRDSALVTALAGRNAPGWTPLTERIADAEAAVELAPDDAFAWAYLGSRRYRLGSYLGDSAEVQRATGILDRALLLDSTYVFPIAWRLFAALDAGDTMNVRRLRRMYLEADSTGEFVDFVRWRTAVALGDTIELSRVRQEFGPWQLSLTSIGYATVYNGLPLDDWELATQKFDEQAVTARARSQVMEQWRKLAAIKGRPTEAIALGDSLIERDFFVGYMHRFVIQQAVLGVPGYDSAAAKKADAAATFAEEDDDVAAWCWPTVWRVHQGDTTGAGSVIRRLYDFATGDSIPHNPLCPTLLEAIVETMSPSSESDAIDRLDAHMRRSRASGLLGTVANFVVARAREAQGDLDGALAVWRRRVSGWRSPAPQLTWPVYLREEGRVAALTGDTTGAIQAYQHYLTLRADPAPSVKPEVDRVRAALARLIGEPGND